MVMASSGSINLAGSSSSPQRSILAELGTTTPISLRDASVRTLAGTGTGPITMPTDFYGKSNYTSTQNNTSLVKNNNFCKIKNSIKN
jgi:hypothetical protein